MEFVYATKRVLQDQAPETAYLNVFEEIKAQLAMQFGIEPVRESDTLDELGMRGGVSGRLAEILPRRFPFLTESAAETILLQAITLEDLTLKILAKAGVECQQSLL